MSFYEGESNPGVDLKGIAKWWLGSCGFESCLLPIAGKEEEKKKMKKRKKKKEKSMTGGLVFELKIEELMAKIILILN